MFFLSFKLLFIVIGFQFQLCIFWVRVEGEGKYVYGRGKEGGRRRLVGGGGTWEGGEGDW